MDFLWGACKPDACAAQEFHNYNPATDIFCHSNRLFWDVTCPGIVDGFGGVMCTGTNYVVRSRALLKVRHTDPFSFCGQSAEQPASCRTLLPRPGMHPPHSSEKVARAPLRADRRPALLTQQRTCLLQHVLHAFVTPHHGIDPKP